jgi:hypothetical protein
MTQSQYDAVLVYDGECPYCSVAARALRRLRAIGAVSWYDEEAQTLLEAQFGETPFSMVLVDRRRNRVYAGRSAAEELAERAGTPGIVSSLVRDRYDDIARAVGAASGRGRDPDDYHDVYPLAEDAAALFGDLAARAVDEADAVTRA